MAQKDYVARGRNNKKAPSPPPKPKLPWLRIIITLSLLSVFAYFLWSLKENAPDTPKATEATAPKKAEQDNLPDMPEEEWEFITSLPEYTVEIENKQQDQPIILRLMQCGSFRKESQAQALKARIAFQGLESQVRTKDGRWYRVILGPYESKRLAEKDRHILQRAKINGCKIWNWNL